MIKQIDVSDIPQPLIDVIESVLRAHRQRDGVQSRSASRPIGWLKGQFELPESFLEELPDDVLKMFEGHNGKVD